MSANLSARAASAVAEFIIDVDCEHDMTAAESTRLWVALQARCPHPAYSPDDEGTLTCDVCNAAFCPLVQFSR